MTCQAGEEPDVFKKKKAKKGAAPLPAQPVDDYEVSQGLDDGSTAHE